MITSALIQPIVLRRKLDSQCFHKVTSCYGNAKVLTTLFPQIEHYPFEYIKRHRRLERVDSHMLVETKFLVQSLNHYCLQLEIDESVEFSIKATASGLTICGEFIGKSRLMEIINNDCDCVETLRWLQTSLSLLAHSFELLEFSHCYQLSTADASRTYSHFSHSNHGMELIFASSCGSFNVQVESPLNCFSVFYE